MSSLLSSNHLMQPTLPVTGAGEDAQMVAHAGQVHRDSEIRQEAGRIDSPLQKSTPKEPDLLGLMPSASMRADDSFENIQLPFHGFSYVA